MITNQCFSSQGFGSCSCIMKHDHKRLIFKFKQSSQQQDVEMHLNNGRVSLAIRMKYETFYLTHFGTSN